MQKSVVVVSLLLSFVAAPLSAHHGKDFLLVESYELPHPHAFYAVSAEEFLFGRSSLTIRDEPSLLLGLTDYLAAEVHAHVGREPHTGAKWEAISPAIHLRLLNSETWNAALSAEYEIGRHGGGNVAALRLIVGHAVGEGAVVSNVGVERDRGSARAIYAFGYRPDIEGSRSWGIEAQGTLHHGEQHEALVAGYGQINDRLTVKGGVGAAMGIGKPVALIRTGIVWRL